MPGNRRKEGKRTFKESTMVCIRVEKDYHKFLKRLAIEKSRETGEFYSVSQLIREIVEERAPCRPQKNMQKIIQRYKSL